MTSISLVLYVRNEEACLEQAVASVKDFVDEVVIFDTGSTDSTPTLAKKLADRFYSLVIPPESMDFGTIETMVTHLAGSEYVLRLDADETLENPHLLQELTEGDYDVWRFPRKRWKDLEHTAQLEKEAYPDHQYRFLRNDKRSSYVGLLHPDFRTPHLVGTAMDVIIHHHVDYWHLSDPKRVEERKKLYEILAKESGKAPEGSPEAMRLAGYDGKR